MTREEALERAETRVYVYMTRGDIDYYFAEYGLEVRTPKGRKKANPTRMEKESALIEYLTDKMTTETTEKADKTQKAYEERFKRTVAMITGG